MSKPSLFSQNIPTFAAELKCFLDSFNATASKINTSKQFLPSLFLIFSLFITFSAKSASQQHEEQDTLIHTAEGIEDVNAHPQNKEEQVDITAVAFGHILDSHSWHLWGEGHDAVSIPLPVIVKGKNGFAFFMSYKFNTS